MVPAAVVDSLLGSLKPLLEAGDIVIDGGNSYYHDDIRRAGELNVAEVWRRGSVIGSWLLDLTASALRGKPELTDFAGRVSDSGEGRWTLQAAIDEGIPDPV